MYGESENITDETVVAYFMAQSQTSDGETKEKKKSPLMMITGLPLEIRNGDLPTKKQQY
jgi:hypothetical protein